MVSAHFGAGRGLRRDRAEGRRSSRYRTAKSLGGRDPALGLPVRRHHHHAGELALHGERTRFLSRRRRGQGHRVRRRIGASGDEFACRRRRCRGSLSMRSDRGEMAFAATRFPGRAGCGAARRCRGVVGDALHLRHDRAAKGRAAAPARRARRGGRARGAKSLRQRRAHARRHAALSHHGRALAARHVADRRRFCVPAPVRCRAMRSR